LDRSDFIAARFGKLGRSYDLKDSPVIEQDDLADFPSSYDDACKKTAARYVRLIFPATALEGASRLLATCSETGVVIREALPLENGAFVGILLEREAQTAEELASGSTLAQHNRLAVAYLVIDNLRARIDETETLHSQVIDLLDLTEPFTASAKQLRNELDTLRNDNSRLREQKDALDSDVVSLRSENAQIKAQVTEKERQLEEADRRSLEQHQLRTDLMEQMVSQEASIQRLHEQLNSQRLSVRLAKLMRKRG